MGQIPTKHTHTLIGRSQRILLLNNIIEFIANWNIEMDNVCNYLQKFAITYNTNQLWTIGHRTYQTLNNYHFKVSRFSLKYLSSRVTQLRDELQLRANPDAETRTKPEGIVTNW